MVSAKKMSECQTKAGNQNTLTHSLTLSLSHSHSLTLSLSYSLTLDMLNNFCFHVYAQKSLSHSHTLYAEKSLFIAENCKEFFGTSSSPSPVTFEFIELVPS